jgi:hypothetical protein
MNGEIYRRGIESDLEPVIVRDGLWILRKSRRWRLFHSERGYADAEVTFGEPEAWLHLGWHLSASLMCVALTALVWWPLAVALGGALAVWWGILLVTMDGR